MELEREHYFHIYNRSNNNEVVFKERQNYEFFLRKYQHYLANDLITIGYCLMPTHFHFLVYVKRTEGTKVGPSQEVASMTLVKRRIGDLLSSYTKSINARFSRHGSLFQEHTKSKLVETDAYLLTLLSYIHQNPVRSGIVEHVQDWEFSSYREYIGLRESSFVAPELVQSYFPTRETFRAFSEQMIEREQVESGDHPPLDGDHPPRDIPSRWPPSAEPTAKS